MTGESPDQGAEVKPEPQAAGVQPPSAPPTQPTTPLTAPSAAPSPTSASASVTIDSIPPGADIEIDGAFVGNTPSTITVAPGTHDITVKKKGFVDWTRKMNVSGGTVHLSAELEAAPAQ
jgi:hypothetical protein